MLTLKLQSFVHLMQRVDSLEKILKLGNIEGKRRRGWQRMRWLDSITDSTCMNWSKLQEIVKERGARPVHEASAHLTHIYIPGIKWEKPAFNSCDPMNCSPPGSSVHGVFQARILEWVAISFSSENGGGVGYLNTHRAFVYCD